MTVHLNLPTFSPWLKWNIILSSAFSWVHPSRSSFWDSFLALDTNKHMFSSSRCDPPRHRVSSWQQFVPTHSMKNCWNDPLFFETGQKFYISIRSGWSFRITLVSMPGYFARRLRSVPLMLLSRYRSKTISIRVLPLDDSINVDHKWLHKSKNVFKLAFLVGTLLAYPIKWVIIIRSWSVAGRDYGHLSSNNLFSSVARSDFLGFPR